MDSKNIALFAAVIAALGFSLYRKYAKKNKSNQGKQSKADSSFPSTKDEDYEPYSKK